MTTVKEIIERIEKFAPPYLAEDWDPIGLAIGSNQQEVKKMMVALDLDARTLQEAMAEKVDFIFTHHPPIFSALKTLNEEDARRKEYIELIRANISLYAAHTNIDAAAGGMNDWLAEALQLTTPYDYIDFSFQTSYKLLVIYTPYEQAKEVRQALHQIGLGQVGDYDNVSYTSEGLGRFRPSQAAEPFIGAANKDQKVAEERAEILVPSQLVSRAIRTLHEVHPYEEPVFHLLDIGKKEAAHGIGRIGDLTEELPLEELIKRVKTSLGVENVRVANTDLTQKVKKVAVLGGSGEKYFEKALAKGADVYITGDISYHGAQDMIRAGLPFIDPGHYVEHIFVDKMTENLKKWNIEEGWDIEVIPASSQQDVFSFK